MASFAISNDWPIRRQLGKLPSNRSTKCLSYIIYLSSCLPVEIVKAKFWLFNNLPSRLDFVTKPGDLFVRKLVSITRQSVRWLWSSSLMFLYIQYAILDHNEWHFLCHMSGNSSSRLSCTIPGILRGRVNSISEVLSTEYFAFKFEVEVKESGLRRDCP